ncbi:SRPBCC family protein [Luteipulveratus halotolerans]|uniref:Polyketide cyclase n=1 Tax=Luteipulveratus halotolerans TaxID=1631356 RepID=A0A0L6CLD0_9MICO|nr:SRPBCC domain-containing protein [Luteipulveratus halotolerans]KNX38606.1 polyketide cyclase [Luteipulveratus halotolerans]
MVDILHQVGVEAPAQQVYDALTTLDGLRGWWTDDTTGSADVGGIVEFRFPAGGFDMKVFDSTPGEHVRWEVVDGPDEWIGTTIDWALRDEDGWTTVNFTHAGWREPVEFMHHCSTKWGTYLVSLKQLVEDGRGAPSPRDVKIIRWEVEAAAAS